MNGQSTHSTSSRVTARFPRDSHLAKTATFTEPPVSGGVQPRPRVQAHPTGCTDLVVLVYGYRSRWESAPQWTAGAGKRRLPLRYYALWWRGVVGQFRAV